ncbi:MAG: hypothetical protein WDO18_05125 [Acidobacteriota bacterium]
MKKLLLPLLVLCSSCFGLNLAAFEVCIQSSVSGTVTCDLDPNTGGTPWLVNHEIHIMRSNVIITTSSGAILKRDPSFYTGPMLTTSGGKWTNVVIQNLKFDGNRYAITIPPNGPYPYTPTQGCAPPNYPVAEIELTGIAHVEITGIKVINSLSHSLDLDGNYSFVTLSEFGWEGPSSGSRNSAISFASHPLFMYGSYGAVVSFNKIGYSGGLAIGMGGDSQIAYGNTIASK